MHAAAMGYYAHTLTIGFDAELLEPRTSCSLVACGPAHMFPILLRRQAFCFNYSVPLSKRKKLGVEARTTKDRAYGPPRRRPKIALQSKAV